MNTSHLSRGSHQVLLRSVAAALLAFGASQGQAASVTLCAEAYTQALPGAGNVPMWGYRSAASAAACSSNVGVGTSSPGPVITVPAGDTTLAVTLVNRLTVPTSIVLAAQALPSDGGAPVNAVELTGPSTCTPASDPQNCRVRSFTGETDAGATRTYTFSNLKPGTYLYQSGTHPQVQVQMGLFGMARQDAQTAGGAVRLLSSDAASAFDVDVPVVLSEVDPAQHALIASTLGAVGNQGAWKAGGNSTLKYAPRFFLINGKVFNAADPAANDLAVAAAPGSRVILRLANAGLTSRSLMLNSGTWKLLTEDGSPYAAAREQATVLLPAGKTSDAMLTSSAPTNGTTNTSVALFDRRGGTDNGDGTPMGGQIARLAQAGPVGSFISPISAQVANEGTLYSLQVQGSGITAYTVANGPAGLTITSGGLINWTVPTGTAVPTNYTLSVSGTGTTTVTPVTFALRVNHTPTIAQTGPVTVSNGAVTFAAPGVLAGATDPDNDALTAVQTAAASAGTLTLNLDGSYAWTRSPLTGPAQTVTFGVAARDPYGLTSTPKTVTLNVAAVNTPPTANGDAYTITLARVLGVIRVVTASQQVTALTRTINTLTGNDVDTDGTINQASVAVVAGSARKINPASPVGCTTACDTIPVLNYGALLGLQAEASVVVNGSTNFRFVPRVNVATQPETGTYEFRYTVLDNQNALSNQAIVRVTVN